jgi:hypothetical protein
MVVGPQDQDDHSWLFNSSLDGQVRRAIYIKVKDKRDEGALKNRIRKAVAISLKGTKIPLKNALLSAL